MKQTSEKLEAQSTQQLVNPCNNCLKKFPKKHRFTESRKYKRTSKTRNIKARDIVEITKRINDVKSENQELIKLLETIGDEINYLLQSIDNSQLSCEKWSQINQLKPNVET